MDFGLLSLQGFRDEAIVFSTLIDACDTDEGLFKLQKIAEENLSWAKNILSSENGVITDVAGLSEDHAKRLINFERRLANSHLSSLSAVRSSSNKQKKCSFSSNSETFPPGTGEASKNFIDNVVLEISLYSSERHSRCRHDFDVLLTSEILEIFEKLECSPLCLGPTAKLFSENFSCPSTISDFRSCLNLPKEEALASWCLIHLGSELFEMGVDGHRLAKIKTRALQKLTWLDAKLNLRLYEPYPLVHDGLCQHFLVLRQLRLASEHDLVSLPKRHSAKSKEKRKNCKICDQFNAVIVTVDDRLAPENPCNFCSACFEALHFDSDGKLLYQDFKIYPINNVL